VQMLIDIEQESDKGFAVFVPLLKSKAIISACEKSGFRHLSRGVRAALVAAIILLSAMTANAAVDKIFDYNIAHEVVSTISEKLKDWGIIASADNNEIVIDEVPTTQKKETSEIEDTTEPSNEPAVEKKTATNETTNLQSEKVNHLYNNQIDIDEITDESVKQETEDDMAQKYTLTFDANGGKCDVSSVEVQYGRPIGELPIPTREGYEFGGWYNIDISYTRTNGKKSEAKLKNSTVYNLEKDATVTAKWYKYYSIVFNANGGQCDVESIQVSLLTSIDKITLPTPTRDGYVFLCWVDMNGDPVTDMQYLWLLAIVSDSYYELTACWVEDGITLPVTFDANGGQCDVKSKDVMIGHPYGELPTPTRSGWKFLGWFAANDLGYDLVIEQITEDTIFAFPYYTELYALWYKTTATVTFDANGGECDVKSKTVYSHNSYGELPTPTKEGYTFGGWYYNERLISSFSDVGEEPIDHTLTAKWIPVNVTVSFNANGGKISSNNDISITQRYGYMTAYGSFPEAAREGYRLVGWYTEPVGGIKVEETDIVDYLDGITLYAHWEEDITICTVMLYSNEDNISLLTYNKGDKLGDVKPTVDGGLFYEFAGWYTDKYYGEKVDSDFEITDDIELYAHWVLDTSLTNITLELEKTEYELNEEIDIRSVDMVLSLSLMNYRDVITGEMLAEADARIYYDTSTYGKHTLTVKLTVDMGYMVTLEASETIFVIGCPHDTGTYIINQLEPTCVEEGYTGDVICSNCNEVLEKGTIINAIGHDENTVTKVTNEKETSCSEAGYTGDTICVVCEQVLQKGKTIDKTDHIYEQVITKGTFRTSCRIAQVCTVCGKEGEVRLRFNAVASLSQTFYTYDGTMKTPEVSVYSEVNKEKIDFTYTMDEGRTELGTYNVYIKINTEYYEDETVLTFRIGPENTTFRLTAIPASFLGGFIAEWDKIDGVDGYQIEYAYDSPWASYTIVTAEDGADTLTVNGLKKGTYYVKIRTIKNGVYSDWSNYKTVKIS
ncbi:MAG: InlB B-repeat-containing protein, partial [Eubacterium sp.]|nr:InlB B-repeat-containing protein [Eubacterium sp.]